MSQRPPPVLALALSLLLAACGRVGGSGPKGPDLSTAEAAAAEATAALAAGDLARLLAASSPGGAAQVKRDLEAWRQALVSPETGPRALSRLPAPRDEAEKAATRRALEGDPGELLRLYVRAEPHAAISPPPAARAPDAAWAQLDYPARDGSRRRIVLTRGKDGWRVESIQL